MPYHHDGKALVGLTIVHTVIAYCPLSIVITYRHYLSSRPYHHDGGGGWGWCGAGGFSSHSTLPQH